MAEPAEQLSTLLFSHCGQRGAIDQDRLGFECQEASAECELRRELAVVVVAVAKEKEVDCEKIPTADDGRESQSSRSYEADE